MTNASFSPARRLWPVVVLGVIAMPALAQDAPPSADWEMVRDAGRNLSLAMLRFDNGIGIAARCRDGDFEMLLTGLPSSLQPVRTLGIIVRDGAVDDQSWTTGNPGTTAFSDLPARFARSLRDGGRLQVIVPGTADQPRTRYVLDLPHSPSALEQTLTACGRPYVDPRDALLSGAVTENYSVAGIGWRVRPTGEYPQKAASQGVTAGWAAVSCLVTVTGQLEQCVVESERPSGLGFGESALRGARRARLEARESGTPGMVQFRTRFFVQ